MDTLFFFLSKLFWSLARPDHLLLLCLTLGLWRSRAPLGGGVQRRGRGLLVGGVAVLWLLAVMPLGQLLLYPLETRFSKPLLDEPPAGVIVLGGAERAAASQRWGSLQVNQHGERILALLALKEAYPQLPFIYTSGSGDPREPGARGADAVERYLDKIRRTEGVTFERESRNTYENARFSRPLADTQGHWLLVTSAFHMPRAVGSFRQQGWQVIPYPVGYLSTPLNELSWHFDLSGNLEDLLSGLHEWLGLFAYRLSGKTPTLFPKPYE
ncbi:YdcF family protein [Motiliproteus sp. SC1-56]|uniref:YdcF family protein n=1 Tax=Motiliproteus sp. SC1-56 TaxID=2799565 RepID=UPI001A8E3631|nr:YdcF family protein [Motiliproteus sp. SC1-56]